MIDYSVLPLMAILVSAAFGAVSSSRDSERRATRSMGTLFLAIALWAGVDLLTYMESDPARAVAWMRWTHVGPLLIGPAALWIVAQMLPQSRGRLESQARVAGGVCLGVGVGVAFVPNVIVDMVPTWYGWMPRYGIVSILLIPLGLILPIHAAIQAARIAPRRDEIEGDRKRVAGLRVCLALSIGVAMPTEYLLPLLEIPFPRLGALGAAIASAVVWLVVLHGAEDLKVTPRGVAREILAELRDGVALLDLDGAILSANARFVEMCGRTGSDLLGTSLGALLDAPVDRIIGGVEDRESSLHAADGTTIPVSLSSSIARNRQGRLIGIVVAVCDRREIDELRRQLLSSGRLAAIGELAAGIAHEVNNPVAFVRSDLNLLAERVGELRHEVAGSPLGLDHLTVFDRVRDRIERAHERLGHVAQVVVDIREFAHVGGAGQGGSDPESVVLGAMRLARMQRGEEVSIRVASVSGSDRCDSGQELKQILLVLLRLLAEGAEKGGAIDAEVRTNARDLVVGLRASPLAKAAHDLRGRIETLTAAGGAADAISVGLASASELIEQLGGRLVVDAVSTSELWLELTIPLAAQSAGEGCLR